MRLPALPLVALALSFLPFPLPGARALQERVPFLSGAEEGRREAAYSGRPVLWVAAVPGEPLAAAFLDGEVVVLARKFVPVLLDPAREALPPGPAGAEGSLLSARLVITDPSGRPVLELGGDATAGDLRAGLKRALATMGPVRLTSAARAEEAAEAALLKALDREDWRGVLREAARLLDMDHEGPSQARARTAWRAAVAEADRRLVEAGRFAARGDVKEAKRALLRIAVLFARLPQAGEAKSQWRLLDAPPPAGGGGEAGGTKGNGVKSRRMAARGHRTMMQRIRRLGAGGLRDR